MNLQLTPDGQTVEPCKILNLVVRRGNGELIHKQYLSVVEFNYGDVLEEVRQKGFIKSDDILVQLGKLLVEKKYVLPADAYVLDIGISGRVSDAVQELYRHSLNTHHSFMKNAVKELSRVHFDFQGPEGTIHVLKADNERVIGHVHIALNDGAGLYETLTLDIFAHEGSDLPYDFKEQVQVRLTEYVADNHPEWVGWQLTVNITQSDLACALESLHDKHYVVAKRHYDCDWVQRL